jgi:hypothetical protein
MQHANSGKLCVYYTIKASWAEAETIFTLAEVRNPGSNFTLTET